MEVSHVEIENVPESDYPFFLTVFAGGEVLELDLTEKQMQYLCDKAMYPLARARAERSTPGLVHEVPGIVHP